MVELCAESLKREGTEIMRLIRSERRENCPWIRSSKRVEELIILNFTTTLCQVNKFEPSYPQF